MFTLRAILICTINDFPAYKNLFGYKNKGIKACPICIDDMQSTYLPQCHKHVFMRTRRLLRRDHPYRKKKKAFDGEGEEKITQRSFTSNEVYEKVKGIERIFK